MSGESRVCLSNLTLIFYIVSETSVAKLCIAIKIMSFLQVSTGITDGSSLTTLSRSSRSSQLHGRTWSIQHKALQFPNRSSKAEQLLFFLHVPSTSVPKWRLFSVSHQHWPQTRTRREELNRSVCDTVRDEAQTIIFYFLPHSTAIRPVNVRLGIKSASETNSSSRKKTFWNEKTIALLAWFSHTKRPKVHLESALGTEDIKAQSLWDCCRWGVVQNPFETNRVCSP